jgi:hypothetical protein
MNPSHRRKLILGGLLAVLAVWLVLPTVLRRGGPAQAHAATADEIEAASTDADVVAPLLSAVAALPTPEALVNLGWPSDPFQRLHPPTPAKNPDAAAAPAETHAGLAVEAIISGSSPRALIQGQIVAVGDQLAGGYTVTAIDAYSVTLAGPQGPWTLTLPQ